VEPAEFILHKCFEIYQISHNKTKHNLLLIVITRDVGGASPALSVASLCLQQANSAAKVAKKYFTAK
jgi:hypothetical protein